MAHIVLHFLVPLVVALACYTARWRMAFLVMIATMLVDLDHLLADPIYDPERCSIGFHPLHTTAAVLLYVMLFAVPLVIRYKKGEEDAPSRGWIVHLIGLGLLIHMALDGIDCIT